MHHFGCPKCGDEDLVRADRIEIWPDSSVLGWLPVTVAGQDGTTDLVISHDAQVTQDPSRRDGLALVVSCLEGHDHVLVLKHQGGFGFEFEELPIEAAVGDSDDLDVRRRTVSWGGDPAELQGLERVLEQDPELSDRTFASKHEAFCAGLHLRGRRGRR